jgi:uncharacterized LabA/DUF88 family protein
MMMRIAIFADVQNAFYAAKHAFQGKLNYGRMLNDIKKDRELIRAFAYMTKRSDIDQSKFCGALVGMGYDVRSRDAKAKNKEGKTSYVKSSYEVMLAMDAVTMSEKVDTIVLITGDSAYLPLINFLKSRGCRVELIGFYDSTSNDLIKASDRYTVVPKDWIIMQNKKEEHEEEEDEYEDEEVVSDDLENIDEGGEQPAVAGQPTAFGMFE